MTLTINSNAIIIKAGRNISQVAVSDIYYAEISVFGNLTVEHSGGGISFPLMILSKNSRNDAESFFTDMAPVRTLIIKRIVEFSEAVFIAALIASHVIQFGVQNCTIPSPSMRDTLIEGDFILAEKFTYGITLPRFPGMNAEHRIGFLAIRRIGRGDIVIFTPPRGSADERDFVKRCIAVAGDDFSIHDGYVFINGKKNDEPYVHNLTDYPFGGKGILEGKVPPESIIVLGDNRNDSKDSRYFGYLPVQNVKSRCILLYWNYSLIKQLDFGRFGLIR